MAFYIHQGTKYKIYDCKTVFKDYSNTWVLALALDRKHKLEKFIVIASSSSKDEIYKLGRSYLSVGYDIVPLPVFDDLDNIKSFALLQDEIYEVDYITPREASLFWLTYLNLPVPKEYLS